MSSTSPEYAERLESLEMARWKQLVPNPYRWNIRRLATGRVLDIGCGIGRCLVFLDGRGVGVDPNEAAIEVCRRRGLEAYTPAEFAARPAGQFDSLLCSHVIEHMTHGQGVEMLGAYLPMVRPGGQVLVIVPQEKGHRSDATHVRRVTPADLTRLCNELGLPDPRIRSFPGPSWLGRWFTHNETIAVVQRA